MISLTFSLRVLTIGLFVLAATHASAGDDLPVASAATQKALMVKGSGSLQVSFSPVHGETILVTNYSQAHAECLFRGAPLMIDERIVDERCVRFEFDSPTNVGAYFRYAVPTGCLPVVRLNGVVRDGVMPGRLNWIWRRWTRGDVVELDFSQPQTRPAARTDRAAWMRGKHGIMVHWLYPSNGDIDRWTEAFDLEVFLADFARTGADWLIFTAGQCRGAYCSPNAAFDGMCGRGHTSTRDLLVEISRGVKRMGKRFLVYAACDFVRDGCHDHAVQRGLRWDNAIESRAAFQTRWPRVLREWSLRLGRDCDGWWLDGLGIQYPHGVDFSVWAEACRAGNPAAALAYNPGGGDFTSYGPSDYAAGETGSLLCAEADLTGPGPIDAVRHYLLPIDGYWGGFWAWPAFTRAGLSRETLDRAELFDQKAMDARLARRDFVQPIYSSAELGRFLRKVRSVGGAVTINVGILPEGRLNPHSVERLLSSRRE